MQEMTDFEAALHVGSDVRYGLEEIKSSVIVSNNGHCFRMDRSSTILLDTILSHQNGT